MMKDLETIKVKNPNGEEKEIKVITILKTPAEDKSFLIYTFDEKQENIDIYASIIKGDKESGYVLDSITEKADWEMIQKAIQELSEG